MIIFCAGIVLIYLIYLLISYLYVFIRYKITYKNPKKWVSTKIVKFNPFCRVLLLDYMDNYINYLLKNINKILEERTK